VEILQTTRGRHPHLTALSASLEEVLAEQTAQIDTTCSNVKLLDLHSDVQAGAARLVGEICKLLELCHRLRDRLQDSLLGLLIHEGRLAGTERQRLIDPATNVYNRLGLERALAEWWKGDPTGSRKAAFALVDIDHLRRINEQWGPLVGERLAARVGRRIAQTLRSNRGFDVAGRLGGQTFAMFLGDTEPDKATIPVERVRQTVAAQRYLLGDQELEVRVTCGVVEVVGGDTTATLCQRAMQTLREAKRAGRNLTLLNTSAGVTVVEPPACDVRPQVVRLDEQEPALA
jgi:diguanylate cyclase (GGDEF)-like protein